VTVGCYTTPVDVVVVSLAVVEVVAPDVSGRVLNVGVVMPMVMVVVVQEHLYVVCWRYYIDMFENSFVITIV